MNKMKVYTHKKDEFKYTMSSFKTYYFQIKSFVQGSVSVSGGIF